jgi:hypothetical protein
MANFIQMGVAPPFYDNDLKIREALQIYFSDYHFADGGYHEKYFHIKLGPVYIPVPNTKARIEAVKMHDIHHILTGYTAYWKGEVEIAGWEIASGCGKYYMAWLLNSGSFVLGLFLFPRALFKAFRRGMRSSTNLYHGYIYSEALLEKTVGQLRRELGIKD